MENVLKMAKLFIFNIIVVLRQVKEEVKEINYVPYEIEVSHNAKSVKLNMSINKSFINDNAKVKSLTNYDIMEKLLIEYLYGENRSFKDKFVKVFDKTEMKLLLEICGQSSRFEYMECMRC